MILILIIITILYTPLWAPPIILSPRKCRNLLPGQGVYLGPATPSKQDGDGNDDKDNDDNDDKGDNDDKDKVEDNEDKDNDDKMILMTTMIAMTMKISAMVIETKILYFFMKNQCCTNSVLSFARKI